jgi:hypothetical protein
LVRAVRPTASTERSGQPRWMILFRSDKAMHWDKDASAPRKRVGGMGEGT